MAQNKTWPRDQGISQELFLDPEEFRKLATRRYEWKKRKLPLAPATHHPLQPVVEAIATKDLPQQKSSKAESYSKKPAFVDPLSSILEGSDPLSVQGGIKHTDPLLAGASSTLAQTGQGRGRKVPMEDVSPVDGPWVISWEAHCAELAKFTTKQHLTLASSFLSSSETGIVKVQNNIPDRTKWTGQTGSERVKARLEQLDSLDEANVGSGASLCEMGGLTQEQFSQHLLSLKEEMKRAWNMEQRVKALKIAIQCVKALALSPPETFYPCKFTIISDLLDALGQLVYTRLKQLMASSHSFTHISPKDEAEETAHNWFYKVSSIRELLPRIYLEAALMPCYAFLPGEGEDALSRLFLICRGVGDPLVGAYIRSYIVHVGLKCGQLDAGCLLTAVQDLILSCRWGWNGNGIENIEVLGEDSERGGIVADKVFFPVFTWLLQHATKSTDSLKTLLALTEESKGATQYVALRSLLKTFPPLLLSHHTFALLHILDTCFAHGENPHELLVDLAVVVTKVSPAEEQRLDILNRAWVLILRVKSVHFYLKAVTAWIGFTGVHYTCKEMDRILGDVLKRLSKVSSAANLQISQLLLELLTTALSSTAVRSEELYSFASFRGLVTTFQRESTSGFGIGACQVQEMRKLLEVALEHHEGDFTDFAVVQLILSLFSSLHDGINALTTRDETRQISHLVISFIRQVNFGHDFELQLEFYVHARAAFSELDPVLEFLIQLVLRLQFMTLRVVKGHHTGKTAAFERACSAYCFITIPSLSCSFVKLRLYLLSGAVAMVNNCMGQGDACMKSAIRLFLELASEAGDPQALSSMAEGIASAVAMAAAYLVATPDPPTDPPRPLYLFWGLVNSLKSMKEVLSPASLCRVNLAALRGVCAGAQQVLPYHFMNVDGNDTLYGGASNLKTEAETICTEILFTVLVLIKETSLSGVDGVRCGDLVSDLLSCLVTYGDMAEAELRKLALNLGALLKRSAAAHGAKFQDQMKALLEERLRNEEH